jgi:hypothetical protein
MTTYWGGDDPAVITDVIASPAQMNSILELSKVLIGRGDLKYILTVDFFCLRLEGMDNDRPSFEEFTADSITERRAYFSDEVTFNVVTSAN